MLNKYQQTGLEKWLRQSTWGVQSKGWSEQQELFELEQEIYKPIGQVSQDDGYQLELVLPRYLHTQAIGLDVTLTFDRMGPGPLRTTTCNIHAGSVTDEGNYLRYRLALTGIYSQMFSTLVRITFPANQGQQQHTFSLSGRGADALSTREAEHSTINSTFTLETETA